MPLRVQRERHVGSSSRARAAGPRAGSGAARLDVEDQQRVDLAPPEVAGSPCGARAVLAVRRADGDRREQLQGREAPGRSRAATSSWRVGPGVRSRAPQRRVAGEPSRRLGRGCDRRRAAHRRRGRRRFGAVTAARAGSAATSRRHACSREAGVEQRGLLSMSGSRAGRRRAAARAGGRDEARARRVGVARLDAGDAAVALEQQRVVVVEVERPPLLGKAAPRGARDDRRQPRPAQQRARERREVRRARAVAGVLEPARRGEARAAQAELRGVSFIERTKRVIDPSAAPSASTRAASLPDGSSSPCSSAETPTRLPGLNIPTADPVVLSARLVTRTRLPGLDAVVDHERGHHLRQRGDRQLAAAGAAATAPGRCRRRTSSPARRRVLEARRGRCRAGPRAGRPAGRGRRRGRAPRPARRWCARRARSSPRLVPPQPARTTSASSRTRLHRGPPRRSFSAPKIPMPSVARTTRETNTRMSGPSVIST